MTSKGQVTIPKEIRERLGLETGDRVDFWVDDHGGVHLLARNRGILDLVGSVKPRVRRRTPLSQEELEKAGQVLEIADGLGISGANENTDAALAQYRRAAGNRLVAIHAAESKETVAFSLEHTGRREVERIMQHLQPDILVHMTHANEGELALVAGRAGIVVCPRANGVIGAGLPDVAAMLRRDCLVAIGTDNVMLNSPDMFRELDYLWKASHAQGRYVEPRELVKMATVNAARMLRLPAGCIEPGKTADLLFIDKRHVDLQPVHDPYAAIVHRAGQNSIGAVMAAGHFVAGGMP